MSKILLLSNNDNVKNLYDWFISTKHDVLLYHSPITIDIINNFNPDFIISYNYKYIIKEEIINIMPNNIINLHTSYLPWNRGSNPNLWSFIDDTPKGVTIHRLEKDLDTGKIIFQKQLEFDEDIETLSSTYIKLNYEIVELLKNNWKNIENEQYPLITQSSKGSYHKLADLEKLLNGRKIDYSMTISEFKKFIKE